MVQGSDFYTAIAADRRLPRRFDISTAARILRRFAGGKPIDGPPLTNLPLGVIDAHGSMLKLDPSDSLFLGSHDYEICESRLVKRLVRPGYVTVDVGAMIGYYTTLLARSVGARGRVCAFEPDPRNFALLAENVAMNNYDHVELRQAVVGSTSGTAELYPAPEQYRGDNRAYRTADRSGVAVDMVALDDVIDEPVDLVKIDVQGYEGHVLSGMTDTIGRSRRLKMLVEYSPPLLLEAETEPADLLNRLKALGFSLFEIDEANQQVRGVEVASLLDRGVGDGDLAMGYTNMLCVKGKR
jgi:FkbM family methyltransferase